MSFKRISLTSFSYAHTHIIFYIHFAVDFCANEPTNKSITIILIDVNTCYTNVLSRTHTSIDLIPFHLNEMKSIFSATKKQIDANVWVFFSVNCKTTTGYFMSAWRHSKSVTNLFAFSAIFEIFSLILSLSRFKFGHLFFYSWKWARSLAFDFSFSLFHCCCGRELSFYFFP